MKEFKGKTAFITGGAEGIGFHIGRALAQQGMNIMLADIDSKMLDQAVATLKGEGFPVEGVVCDVISKDALKNAAQKTIDTFGKVHILVNNAGVSCEGSQDRISEDDWRWIIDTNLMGVVYGAQVFVPLMKSHGEDCHILNVASMAGMQGRAHVGPYCATKAAVVSLSESWHEEYQNKNIDVSVFCPGFIKSRIYDSKRNRQEQYGGPIYFEDRLKEKPHLSVLKEVVVTGIDTQIAANRALEGIMNEELYIFSHAQFHKMVEERSTELKQAFDTCHNSPALETIPKTGDVL